MRDFAQYFDGIFCLSLPSSTDRRQHIERHFRELGIEGYEFFDATGSDDPEVQALYAAGNVHQYPPCFRCGKLACGSDDCSNILIPEQVATFVSYLRLWRYILETACQTILVVEDDVIFTKYAAQVAEAVMRNDLLNRIGLGSAQPTLLRLGWAFGPEHRLTERVGLKKDQARSSNPCHAINRAMAKLLVESFESVDTTADIYIHEQIATRCANYTLHPPIASELSWSFGAVDSLIHPKSVRVAYLKKHHPERVQEIEATIQALRTHVKHIAYRPLLAIGHPRCGSGYMGQLLKACGLDVGHERIGQDGISSWMFAVEDEENPFALDSLAATRKNKHFGHVIHFVRDPRTAIPSIIRENHHSQKSYDFRRRHILKTYKIDLDDAGSEVEKALLSYIYWNKIIEEQKTDLMVRVEDAEDTTLRFLKAIDIVAKDRSIDSPPPKDVNRQKLYQGKLPERPCLTEADWDDVDEGLKKEANAMCGRYGYPAVFE
jgi:GR25 family glycosyltransferase involved in LPS biosynthesis